MCVYSLSVPSYQVPGIYLLKLSSSKGPIATSLASQSSHFYKASIYYLTPSLLSSLLFLEEPCCPFFVLVRLFYIPGMYERVVAEHVPQARHIAISPHEAAKHVRADQSATTQASRQSWREPAFRRAFEQLAAFSNRTKKSKSCRIRVGTEIFLIVLRSIERNLPALQKYAAPHKPAYLA